MIATEYTVLTPHGQFTAMWDENEDVPVVYAGGADAVAYVRAFIELNSVSGPNGALLAFDHLEPEDLYGFCQSREYGIVVLPEPDDMLAMVMEEAQDDE